jgi:hypothetical protein
MQKVEFIRMEDGTREEYEFLDRLEDEYKAGLPDRIMESMRKLANSPATRSAVSSIACRGRPAPTAPANPMK